MNCVIEAWHCHEQELRGFFYRQLHDWAQADDLLQDIFLKAMAQQSRFCAVENRRAWLFRVAKNSLIDYLRSHQRSEERGDVPEPLEEELPPLLNLAECLPHALQRLGAAEAAIIQQCDLEGMSQQAYADQAALSLPATKSRLQRARKRLKQELQQLCQVRFSESGTICCFTPCSPKAIAVRR
ncbi:sigma-70 family RNA polymerase sigma factor [Ectothiorhodospiraceae bacterium BW-2]|nr:sigma-70 family RNA polymerase sigma factor [Ectothiorhodospiraceae bacterium BW-2]